ncbi:MAG: YARHG domain-containing protein [Candidatus Aminicenantes bacterium]|nr:YARHG domain-containing protein [Candidatus Aminicenantes bacterium]
MKQNIFWLHSSFFAALLGTHSPRPRAAGEIVGKEKVMVGKKKQHILWILLLMAFQLARPLPATWTVQPDSIGDGIPTWMAMVRSRDGRLLFWIDYPTDGPCVPLVVLKSDGWQAFAFNPKTIEYVAAVIRFGRERVLEVSGYAANGFIFEWELGNKQFADMLTAFAAEQKFIVSLPGCIGEVTGTFDLDSAPQAIGEACSACEQSFLENNDFVFVDSSERRLERDEVVRLSANLRRIARNEIFARRGRVFRDPPLDKFFRTKKWYRPVSGEVELTAIEKANVALLVSCRKN